MLARLHQNSAACKSPMGWFGIKRPQSHPIQTSFFLHWPYDGLDLTECTKLKLPTRKTLGNGRTTWIITPLGAACTTPDGTRF